MKKIFLYVLLVLTAFFQSEKLIAKNPVGGNNICQTISSCPDWQKLLSKQGPAGPRGPAGDTVVYFATKIVIGNCSPPNTSNESGVIDGAKETCYTREVSSNSFNPQTDPDLQCSAGDRPIFPQELNTFPIYGLRIDDGAMAAYPRNPNVKIRVRIYPWPWPTDAESSVGRLPTDTPAFSGGTHAAQIKIFRPCIRYPN